MSPAEPVRGGAATESETARHIALVNYYSARNYAPLPVVLSRGQGAWVEDVEGHRYLDMLSAYSAVNFGHCHPELVAAFVRQSETLTLTSRAFHNDQFGPFCEELSELTGQELVLPMNTGAEAVETALKTARKWGYKVKGVPEGKAEIVCCEGNFHGRTISIVSFSDDPQYRDGFGPFTPGFKLVPYGDLAALEKAIGPHTVGFLVEPIQGEGGIVVPPAGYLSGAAELCRRHRVLFMADEIQTGLGRTGRVLACEHEGVKPDLLMLGKALGGGMMPVSAALASRDVLGVFEPGDHGSTFGGNPLACAVARAAMRILQRDRLSERAETLGAQFMAHLRGLSMPVVKEIRGKGLLIGIELHPDAGPAKDYAKKLKGEGLLCKDTVQSVLRLAPPLVVDPADLDWASERLARVLG